MADLKLINDIFELCTEKLNDRFNSFSQMKESLLHVTENNQGLDDIDYRSEVLLYGADVTIRIQFFYNCMFFGKYLNRIYDDVTKDRVIDFFNEVGNLTGGKVKEIFFEQGIVTALSLPMSIETTKEKIVRCKEVLKEQKMFESSYKDQNIYMAKISFEIHAPEKFSKFDKNLSKLDVQDGDVDFF